MTYTHDPDAVLDYGADWSAWLAEVDDTITASTWTISTIADDEAPLVNDAEKGDTFDDTTTTIWVKGGTVGEIYKLINHITTAAGRQDDRTLTVEVEER